MPAPEVVFQLLDGQQAGAHGAEVEAIRAEATAGQPGSRGRISGGGAVADRFDVQARQTGFVLALALSGDYLVGCAAGMPLRPSTSWWRGLTTPLPDDVTAERAGRTFALTDLLVRAPWRRQGIGRALHDLTLAGRAEERATVVLAPAATAAQAAFRNWGWRKIARTRGPDPASPALDVLVVELPLGRRR